MRLLIAILFAFRRGRLRYQAPSIQPHEQLDDPVFARLL